MQNAKCKMQNPDSLFENLHFALKFAIPVLVVLFPIAADGRVDRRLQHLPREQAALLPVRGQPSAVQFKHVLGRELLYVIDRFAMHLFQQHRGGGLADYASLAGKKAIPNGASFIQLQFDANYVAAQRVIFLMRMRGRRQITTMERILVVIEDVLLIKFFFIRGHGA
jgi:hypothetical protein